MTRTALLPILLMFSLCAFDLPAATPERLALVIGNADYATSPLKNPANDAGDLSATLQGLEFTVILKKNVGLKEMEDSLRDFGNRLKRSGGVGLFFFAGHGVQINGKNFLVPVGARIDRDTDVKYQALDAEQVIDEMANAGNSLNIVILDACRDNPFGRSFRTASRGLAILSSAPMGTFITYSTSPGKVASDGEGSNSPYTLALLKYMTIPGLPIEQVFKKVRQELVKQTGGQQLPWELSSLEGDFYFSARPSSSAQTPTAVSDPAPSPSRTPSTTSDSGDLARNPRGFGYPSPLESDPGWGGGNHPWQLLDGIRTYPNEWARGLAFTGGPKGWGDADCGWRQATVDFGAITTFNRVVLWHHGLENVPANCKVQYWNASKWMDAYSTTTGKAMMKFRDNTPKEWWEGWSTPMEIVFPSVKASKVRFAFDNCDTEHGWLYEFEVYNDR